MQLCDLLCVLLTLTYQSEPGEEAGCAAAWAAAAAAARARRVLW